MFVEYLPNGKHLVPNMAFKCIREQRIFAVFDVSPKTDTLRKKASTDSGKQQVTHPHYSPFGKHLLLTTQSGTECLVSGVGCRVEKLKSLKGT